MAAGSASGPSPAPRDESADELVRRVLRGEVAAFEAIVRRHQAEVWKVVVAVAPWADEALLENLTQQTFVNAYERLAQYRPGDLGRWLKAIARNLVREEARRFTRETARLEHYRAYLDALTEDDARAEEYQQALTGAVAACRERLAPDAARALALRYEEAQPLEAVAAAIGRSLTATQQLLYRARLALRACVEQRLGAE